MANIYSWDINNFDVLTQQGENSNVIKTVHYVFTGHDENNEEHKFSSVGAVMLDEPTDSFIDYDSITKEDVISWIETKLDVSKLKLHIDYQIDDLKKPQEVRKTPNWHITEQA